MDEAAIKGLHDVYKVYLNNKSDKDKTIALLVIRADLSLKTATDLLDMAIQLNRPKYFRWSDTVVDSCGESYSSAITMGKDPYNGGKDFKILCENTTGDHTFPYADWRKGSCIEITAEEAESYMQPASDEEVKIRRIIISSITDDNDTVTYQTEECDHLNTLYNDQLGCMQCMGCGAEFGN